MFVGKFRDEYDYEFACPPPPTPFPGSPSAWKVFNHESNEIHETGRERGGGFAP
jgi:hypothetical protein